VQLHAGLRVVVLQRAGLRSLLMLWRALMLLSLLLLRYLVKAVKQVPAGRRAAAGMLPLCACTSVQHTRAAAFSNPRQQATGVHQQQGSALGGACAQGVVSRRGASTSGAVSTCLRPAVHLPPRCCGTRQATCSCHLQDRPLRPLLLPGPHPQHCPAPCNLGWAAVLPAGESLQVKEQQASGQKCMQMPCLHRLAASFCCWTASSHGRCGCGQPHE
jgi:hypothetical protein